jgi:glycosyltransferase involved in cell wall biosynthesis
LTVRPVAISANSCHNLIHFRGSLIAGLQEAGYRLVAIAPDEAGARALADRDVEVCRIPLVRSSINPFGDLRLLLAYVRTFIRRRPAAYCGFTIKANVYGGLAARICGVPMLANITGLGTAFLAEGKLWRLTSALYRMALKRANAVFFHNADDLQAFTNARIIAPSQARLIPGSGIDLSRFRPEPPPAQRGGATTFLFVGRLIRDKGIYEFVDAARILRQRRPSLIFQLLGDPDPQNRTSIDPAELQSWIDEGVVEHLGAQEDVRPFMRAATAIVLPSYREGMSRALLEAAAMGRPMIGTDVPGVRELVEDGVTGMICRPRDAKSLADAMDRLLQRSDSQLIAMGENARAKVEREFDEKLVLAAYLEELNLIRRAQPDRFASP